MQETPNGSQCLKIRVEHLTPSEVMQCIRRMMLKTYLILWVVTYAVVILTAFIQKEFNVFVWAGPAVILILLALAYEYSCRKNYGPLKYDEAVLDYEFTPKGFRLTIGDGSAEFLWENTKVVKTRSNYLLYTDSRNSSVLPKRCLTEEETWTILAWAKG